MRGYVRRGMQEATFDLEQIPEVQHAVLMDSVGRQLQRENWTTNDRRLQKHRGAETDDGAAVVQRIEVVGLRVGIQRIAPVDDDVVESVEADAIPFTNALWM